MNFVYAAQDNENILAIIAVGSAVRPNVRSADLDLVVVCKDAKALRDKRPIEVDLRVYETDEVEGLIEQGNDLLGWAVLYGKPLFQRESFWDQILTSWRHRLPLPSVDVALQRADDAYRRLGQMLESGDRDAAHEQAISYATHLARAKLLRQGLHPASRPELPSALRGIGDAPLADWLERLIEEKGPNPAQLLRFLRELPPSQPGQGSVRSHGRSTERRPISRRR